MRHDGSLLTLLLFLQHIILNTGYHRLSSFRFTCILLYIWGLSYRRDSQEFESDNDLPYCRHKRARLCLVCKALMQRET